MHLLQNYLFCEVNGQPDIHTQYTCTYITRIVLFLGHYVVDRQAIFNNPPYLAYLLASFCYSYVYIMWHCDIDVAINDIISIILSLQKLKTRCIHVQLKILAGGPCTGLARVGWRHGGTGHTFTEYVTLLEIENINLDINTFGNRSFLSEY